MENYIKVSWDTSRTTEPTDTFTTKGDADRSDEMVRACAVMVHNVVETLATVSDRNKTVEWVLATIQTALCDDVVEVVSSERMVVPSEVLPDEQ